MTWPGGCHAGRSSDRYHVLSTSVATLPATAALAVAAPVARKVLAAMAWDLPVFPPANRDDHPSAAPAPGTRSAERPPFPPGPRSG